jgi:hypothetical protein
MRNLRAFVVPFAVFGSLVAGGVELISCGGGGHSGPAGGPAPGLADMHCVDPSTGQLDTQTVSQADCQFRPPPDAAEAPDAPGTVAADAASAYGPTMFGTVGNDDDCKYHVTWTSTAIYEDTDVFFTVVATTLVDNMPATGANIYAEVFLSSTHEAPPTDQAAVEKPPGTYKVGPIQFDEAGTWTVRFHLHENCLDYAEDSPHGHAAFFLDVP